MLEKQIELLHTNKCSDNKFETRLEGTTQPWFGENLYSENRDKPRVPWKPEDSNEEKTNEQAQKDKKD